MDHEQYLETVWLKSAAEKAAIIRPGVTAIVAPQIEEALRVIVRQCQSAGVEPRLLSGFTTDSRSRPRQVGVPYRPGQHDR